MAGEDYFDIDAILASEPRVYVTFDVLGRSLGHLGERPDEEDLAAGSKVAVPLWMAESLSTRRMVRMQLPRCYAAGSPLRNELRADPLSADLRAATPHYFALGVRLAQLLRAPALAPALLAARAARAWRAVDCGSHATHAAAILRILDNSERQLFFAARAANVARARWVERRCTRLQAADDVRRPAAAAVPKPPVQPEAKKRPAPDTSPITPRAQRPRVQ